MVTRVPAEWMPAWRGAEGGGGDSSSIECMSDTNGIACTTADLVGKFRHGMLVVQDGFNDKGFQNFKFVPLEKVLGDQ